jgi:hypothetical protein
MVSGVDNAVALQAVAVQSPALRELHHRGIGIPPVDLTLFSLHPTRRVSRFGEYPVAATSNLGRRTADYGQDRSNSIIERLLGGDINLRSSSLANLSCGKVNCQKGLPIARNARHHFVRPTFVDFVAFDSAWL